MRIQEIKVYNFGELPEGIKFAIIQNIQRQSVNERFQFKAIAESKRIGVEIDAIGATGMTGRFERGDHRTAELILLTSTEESLVAMAQAWYARSIYRDDFLSGILTFFHDKLKREFNEELKYENILHELSVSDHEFLANGTLFDKDFYEGL